ncbi:MAG: response regulator transcription factor [Chromatiales bacterium]
MRIALLEDDPDQAAILQTWVEGGGHRCRSFALGEDFIEGVQQEGFGLYIIDWELPDISGLEVLNWIRQKRGWTTPVLFVTVRDSEEDVVRALEHGADDYMTKPLRQLETMARISALARRGDAAQRAADQLQFGDYRLNSAMRNVAHGDNEIELTETEFELACYLFRNSGRLLSRESILEHVWKRGPEFNTRTVDTHISRLRKKLQLTPDNGWRLSSIYRYGYRLEPTNAPEA